MNAIHRVTRIRHEVDRRLLTVKAVERLTPNMIRVTFCGDSLEGFVSYGHDDHVKLLFPPNGEASSPDRAPADASPPVLQNGGRPIMRDYTPRRYDAAAQELVIDFAMHGAGPATDWAAQSRPGQQLEIGGPRGSFIVADDFDWRLFVGDETALPAIGRGLEELRAGLHVIVVAAIADGAEQQHFRSRATVAVHWVYRPASKAADASILVDAVSALTLPNGDGYVWVAGESDMARTLRKHLLLERGLDKAWVKAAGYWRQGGAGVHEPLND